jgi:hypothetical protein
MSEVHRILPQSLMDLPFWYFTKVGIWLYRSIRSCHSVHNAGNLILYRVVSMR